MRGGGLQSHGTPILTEQFPNNYEDKDPDFILVSISIASERITQPQVRTGTG